MSLQTLIISGILTIAASLSGDAAFGYSRTECLSNTTGSARKINPSSRGEGSLAGLDFSAAEQYADSQRPFWGSVWSDMGVDSCLAEAVIFPELIRYSALQDRVEEAVVAASYMMRGLDGADFSIGRFQMKASFVESLERRWMRSPLSGEMEIWFDTRTDSRMARKARMDRLRDPFWQCVYLACFLKLLYVDYPDLKEETPAEQVRLCAAAYNHGIRWPKRPGMGNFEQIYEWTTQASYHTDFLPSRDTHYYIYSEIAVAHYLKKP